MGAKIASNINANPQFDQDAYELYKKQLQLGTPKIWTLEQMDHVRLPGNIDITELLIYIGQRFFKWLEEVKYEGEIPIYSASYPDNIYSIEGIQTAPTSNDSPHQKVPMIIAYSVRYRAPATMSEQPFQSRRKQWNFRTAGEFRTENGDVYIVRERFLDNLVEFTIVARSGTEADWLVRLFETFMDLNQSYFMAAGMNKMAYYARTKEQDETLDKSGFMNYRKTLFFIRTQEFKYTGPIGVLDAEDVQIETSILEDEIAAFKQKMEKLDQN